MDKFLADAERLGSRRRASEALARGQVFRNDAELGEDAAAQRLASGDVVALWLDRPGSASQRFAHREAAGIHLLYEDDALVVVNKAAGLLTVPLAGRDEDSVASRLEASWRATRQRVAWPVHRLDRDTTGVVVFAKTGTAREHLRQQFMQHAAVREYVAVVSGEVAPPSGEWADCMRWDDRRRVSEIVPESFDRAMPARLRYHVREALVGATVLDILLITGRRNQIRLQAAHRGWPVVGERQYAPARGDAPRQLLHAWRLSIAHPVDGRPLVVEAPLPPDVAEFIEAKRRRRRR